MKSYALASLLLLARAAQSVDVTFYEGTAHKDCAGTTHTADSVPADKCSHDSGKTFDCLLVEYDGSHVKTAKPFSKQHTDYCAVALAVDLDDGEYYENAGSITGFKWQKLDSRRFRRSLTAESMENKRSSSPGLRYLGYTVNGRTYDIPEEQSKNIPKGGEDVQEDWLKQQGYVVVKDLANFKRKVPEKKDVSERSEQQE
jgi:hypothetical protein